MYVCIPVQLIQVVGAMVSPRPGQKPKTQRAASTHGIWKCWQTTTIPFYVRSARLRVLPCPHFTLACCSVRAVGIVIRMVYHGSNIYTPAAAKFGTAFQTNRAPISAQHLRRWCRRIVKIRRFGCRAIRQWFRRTCSPSAVCHYAEPNRSRANLLSSFHVLTPPIFAPATQFRKVSTLRRCLGWKRPKKILR